MSQIEYDVQWEANYQRWFELAEKTDLDSQIEFMERSEQAEMFPVGRAILGSLKQLKTLQATEDENFPCACPAEHHKCIGSDSVQVHYRCGMCHKQFKV